MAYWSEWLTPGRAESDTFEGNPYWEDAGNAIDENDSTYTRNNDYENYTYITFDQIPVPDVALPGSVAVKGAQIRALLSNTGGSSDPTGIRNVDLLVSGGYQDLAVNYIIDHTAPQWAYFGGESGYASELSGENVTRISDIKIRMSAYNPTPNSIFVNEDVKLYTFQVRFWIEGPSQPIEETLELSSESNGAAIQALIAEIAESYAITGGQAQKFIAARLLADIVGMQGQRYGSEMSLKVCAAKYYTWPSGLFHVPEYASLRMRSHDVLAMDDGIRIRQNSDGPMADLSATWIWVGDDADTMERWIRQTCDTPFSAQAEIFGQPQKIYGAWLSPPTIARRTRHIEVSGEMSIVW